MFRLTTYNGSEFLFQADDRETMLDWIKAIQCNSNPDGDVSFDKNIRTERPFSNYFIKGNIQKVVHRHWFVTYKSIVFITQTG